MNVRSIAARVPSLVSGAAPSQPGKHKQGGTPASFANELRHARGESGDVKLSAHAQSRMVQRGIAFSSDDRQNMAGAMDELERKGAKNTLMLRGESAFLVNIPNRTIITAMDASDLSERAFTNIDSAYLLSNSR